MTSRIGAFIILSAIVIPAYAQQPDAYGTASETTVSIGAFAFQGANTGDVFATLGNGYRYLVSSPSANFTMAASVTIPSGVTITRFGFDYCDSNPAGDFFVALNDQYGDDAVNTPALLFPPDRTGCGTVYSDPLSYSFDSNAGHQLVVIIGQPNITDGSVRFRGVEISYRRNISPAPATATFSDVPTNHLFFQFIEALAASGITAGCNVSPPQFCPDAPLTRGQMAVFISRALGLHWPN
jgi:hypothetical protein